MSTTSNATVWVRCRRRLRATRLGREPKRCADSCTRLRVASDTGLFPLSACETVVRLTPASAATSEILMVLPKSSPLQIDLDAPLRPRLNPGSTSIKRLTRLPRCARVRCSYETVISQALPTHTLTQQLKSKHYTYTQHPPPTHTLAGGVISRGCTSGENPPPVRISRSERKSPPHARADLLPPPGYG